MNAFGKRISGYGSLYFILLVLIFSSCTTIRFAGSSIPYHPKVKFEGHLPDELSETSGLEFYKNCFWSFNDSGGEASLYALPYNSLSEIKAFTIPGIGNVDWEDISQDEKNFYIADVGNNFGGRDTLIIYIIPKLQLFGETLPEAAAIKVVFDEKTPEFLNKRRNPFDCEALIFNKDSLFLFTKNWSDESSWVYKFPAVPGTYILKRTGMLNPGMLVTGACLNSSGQDLWLIGYHDYKTVITVYDFSNPENMNELFKIFPSKSVGLQTEGICIAHDRIYFSYEKSRKRQGISSINLPQ